MGAIVKKRKNSGQTTVEYILVMAVVVMMVIMVMSYLKKSQYLYKHLASPLVGYIRYNYKYADPQAQGWDEGSPRRHIQISTPNDGSTFRLFTSAKSK